jgi:hypothetical protein
MSSQRNFEEKNQYDLGSLKIRSVHIVKKRSLSFGDVTISVSFPSHFVDCFCKFFRG